MSTENVPIIPHYLYHRADIEICMDKMSINEIDISVRCTLNFFDPCTHRNKHIINFSLHFKSRYLWPPKYPTRYQLYGVSLKISRLIMEALRILLPRGLCLPFKESQTNGTLFTYAVRTITLYHCTHNNSTGSKGRTHQRLHQ